MVENPNRSPQQLALFGLHVALLTTLPFWLDMFSRTGSSFDMDFVERTILLSGRLPHIDYAAALVATVGLAIVIFIVAWISARFPAWFFSAFCLVVWAAALIPLLNYLRITADISAATLSSPSGIAVIVAFVAAAAAYLFWKPVPLSKIFGALNSIAGFVGAIVLLNGAVALAKTAPDIKTAFSDQRPIAPALTRSSSDRPDLVPIIWIIFDEWDYRLSFEARPKGLLMPATDRLLAESFSSVAAQPPGKATGISLPSLTTGLQVTGSKQGPAGDLVLDTADGREIAWRQTDSVFDRARAQGANIALLSHLYGPYCGSFHRAVVACWEIGRWWQASNSAIGALDYVLTYGLRFLPKLRLSTIRKADPDYRRFSEIDGVNTFQSYQRKVEQRLSEASDDLLFLHYEMPHYPVIYDRTASAYRSVPAPDVPSVDQYADNLALVDLTIARIRSVLEKSGKWDRSVLIISSDHHFRHGLADVPIDFRVPFIVKLPGQRDGVVYRAPLNTQITSDLVPVLMNGEVADYEALAKFVAKTPAAGSVSLPDSAPAEAKGKR